MEGGISLCCLEKISQSLNSRDIFGDKEELCELGREGPTAEQSISAPGFMGSWRAPGGRREGLIRTSSISRNDFKRSRVIKFEWSGRRELQTLRANQAGTRISADTEKLITPSEVCVRQRRKMDEG
mmetsp:Transcript_27721/g.76282  ORF Transcript_27721/g.76282 Transcript_27721/m.76282 type:complete len:126 (-) Transcript_27721:25-402(-)